LYFPKSSNSIPLTSVAKNPQLLQNPLIVSPQSALWMIKNRISFLIYWIASENVLHFWHTIQSSHELCFDYRSRLCRVKIEAISMRENHLNSLRERLRAAVWNLNCYSDYHLKVSGHLLVLSESFDEVLWIRERKKGKFYQRAFERVLFERRSTEKLNRFWWLKQKSTKESCRRCILLLTLTWNSTEQILCRTVDCSVDWIFKFTVLISQLKFAIVSWNIFGNTGIQNSTEKPNLMDTSIVCVRIWISNLLFQTFFFVKFYQLKA
jgi:hypothetical protein